jgi:hypothetical protein
VDVLQAFLYSIILGASMGLFEETSVIGGLENENESVRLSMFCQHEKVPYSEFT